MPTEPRPYKSTLFDRHGPDAVRRVLAVGYGLMVFGLLFGVSGTLMPGATVMRLVVSIAGAALTSGLAFYLSEGVGAAWNQIMYKGSSTPYVEQFSYQQSLVMQGRVDEALASFEAVIAEAPNQISARIKAAELYLRDSRDVTRACELLKQVQRIAEVTPGEDVYVSNRLADLLAGPLGKPGAALVELRRLVDRYPELPAATHAREAIARIKSSLMPAEDAAP